MAEPIGGQPSRRQFLIAGGAAAVLFGASSARARPVAADPAVTGSWTRPFGLTLVSTRAVMLHTGSVLLFSWPNKTVGSDAVLWHPAPGKITNIALSYQRDIFCSGMSVLPDGRVLSAGESYGSLKQTGEIFSPPYLFKGARRSPAPRPRWATAARSPSAARIRAASNGWRWSRRPR
jgi:hypothetical protein